MIKDIKTYGKDIKTYCKSRPQKHGEPPENAPDDVISQSDLTFRVTQGSVLDPVSLTTSAHIYLQFAVHVFTTSGIYGVFAVHLDLDSAKLPANALVSSHLNTVIHFCSGLQILTSPNSNVF